MVILNLGNVALQTSNIFQISNGRFSSNIFQILNIRFSSNILTLNFWFRCVELDYSQDQINIDSDYGEEWRVEETETNGDEGEFDFMIGLRRKQIKLKPSEKRAKLIS